MRSSFRHPSSSGRACSCGKPSDRISVDAMRPHRQTATRGSSGQRTMRSEASPGQLLTHDVNRNPRYPYAETPVDMQRPVVYPLSSPTDSMIDESPISPVSGQDLQGLPLPHINPGFAVEKTGAIERSASPYNFPEPSQPHPALFAPYADDGMSPQFQDHRSQPQPPQSPGPIPIKTESQMAGSAPTLVLPATATNRMPTFNAQAVVSDDDRRLEVYNPDSLSGPNVAPEAHRPGQVSHPNAAVDPEWRHGLCEIDTVCCLGIWCPCVLYGKTQYRLSQKAQRQDATDLLGYKSYNGSCGVMALACGLQCKMTPPRFTWKIRCADVFFQGLPL